MRFVLPVLAAIIFATPAAATVYQIDAHKKSDGSFAFWVTFDDFDNDRLVSIDEVTGTSGFTYGSFRDLLVQVPNESGLADGSGTSWVFGWAQDFTTVHTYHASYNYTFTAQPGAAVPVPAAGVMLLSGFGAFAALRRRRRG